jgi:hypothetical protein
MSAHALLAPSSAARWVACAGSVLLASLYPETEETPDAAAGTAAHWVASEWLENGGLTVSPGEVAPNGVTLTDEICEGAEMYVDAIDAALRKYGVSRDALHVEERVAIPYVHEQNWGTPDAWFYVPAHGALCVFDFKYGHDYVDVFENWQLLDYVCGILDVLGIDGAADQTLRVEMTIVQPRNYHRDGPVRTWSTLAVNLRGYFNQLRNAAEAALLPGAKCTPNLECQHCPGRHACEALQRDAYRSAQIATESLPLELSPNAQGLELKMLKRAAKMLDARISGLEESVAANIRKGKQVSHYSLVPKVGRVTWSKPDAEVIALGSVMNVELAKPKLITPNQAIKAGVPEAVVKSFSHAPQTGLELVEVDDKQLRKVFG